jgi:diguanylate cyclase (GGDEF)-like protein
MEVVNILIVEDIKEDAAYLEQAIKSRDYNVWVACGENEALQLVRNIAFTVALVELRMPQMDAIKITKSLLKLRPQMSVLVITPYAFLDSAVQAMQEGAFGYLTKPFNAPEIKVVLEHSIERYYLLSSDKAREHFAQLSIRDGLTGVFNRRFLNMFLFDKVSSMKQLIGKCSLLMVDIDHFKVFNDTRGHPAGDELLNQLCKLFQDSVRQGDIVFRYGGEEFLIFLEHTSKQVAYSVSERIRQAVQAQMPVTVSIGISTFPDDGQDTDELINKADVALYKAKEQGRNRVCLS